MNKEKLWCKCGYGPAGKKEINKHVFEKCTTEKGQHGRVKKNPEIPPQSPPLPDAEKIQAPPHAEPPGTPVVEEKPIIETKIDKAPPETKEAPGVALKKSGGRRWWMVWAGLGSIGLSLPIFMLSSNGETPNTMLQLIFAVFFLGGAAVAWMGLKKREEGVIFKDIKSRSTKPFKGKANCLNIYYRLERGKLATDRIAFEQFPEKQLEQMETDGMLSKLHKCRNDGNYYYVHELMPDFELQPTKENKTPYPIKWKPIKDWKLAPFILTDTVYFSPRELANVVTMPACTKYLRPKPNKFDKIKPALLMIGAGILAVLIVVFSSPATPGGV